MAKTRLAEVEEIDCEADESAAELLLSGEVDKDEATQEEDDSEDIRDDDDGKKRYAAGKISRKEIDATRLYLKEIEFSPLLTADEENTIQDSRKKAMNQRAPK